MTINNESQWFKSRGGSLTEDVHIYFFPFRLHLSNTSTIKTHFHTIECINFLQKLVL